MTVTIFEDFMCPFCASLERHVGPLLAGDVEAGTVRVLYRPLDFLDWASSSDYSARAAGAAACAQDLGGTPAFVAVHAELFARQPDEGSAGLADDDLVDLAAAAGVSRFEARLCIEDGRYAAWIEAGTDLASRAGIDTVPVVLVDGDQVDFSSDEVPEVTLRRAIDQALAR